MNEQKKFPRIFRTYIPEKKCQQHQSDKLPTWVILEPCCQVLHLIWFSILVTQLLNPLPLGASIKNKMEKVLKDMKAAKNLTLS